MKKYKIIYADPPWNVKYFKIKKAKAGAYNPSFPMMSDKSLMELPIKKILSNNAILFLWCLDTKIPILLPLMLSWGFTFKTIGFIWNKTRKDGTEVNACLNWYTRKSCEICYIGTKGKTLITNHSEFQFIAEPKIKHSKKPECVYQRIVNMCGKMPRIELFARESHKGWDTWGNEIENSIDLEKLKKED